MRRSRSGVPFPRGAAILQRIYTRLGCAGRPPHFTAEFYPYASLVHTIRVRDDAAYVRFSDLMRDAPLPALEAAAAILLARVFGRRLPRQIAETYRNYSLARGTRRRVNRVRRGRARPARNAPRGGAHNLAPSFARLNAAYFQGRLAPPRLGWSNRPWRAQLGCFDPALNQIVLSSRLDHTGVPSYVVEYVLFHEMLHMKHPLRRASCGLEAHSSKFRAEEKRFLDYERARRFLRRLR